jgi:hypothetical protein
LRARKSSRRFGRPSSILAAPERPPSVREPSIYAVGWAGVSGRVLARLRWDRPTSRANSRFSPRDDVGACPARYPVRSSGAAVRPWSARPGLSDVSVPSTGPVPLASPPPYHHDLGPRRVLLLSLSAAGLLCWQPFYRSRLVLPSTIQATLGDNVVHVPPSIPCTLVPLDGALVRQLLKCIVVA